MVEFTLASRITVGVCQVLVQSWRVFVDKVSNAKGFRVRIVMISLKGLRLEKSLRLGFRASNNEAEYEALITGLRATQKLVVEEVEIFSDSRLVVSQVEGSFEAKDLGLSQYLMLFGTLQACFQKVSVARVPKSQNSHANSLATLASLSNECVP